MNNKTVEEIREHAINKWAWARHDYFILQMKDRWDSDDYAYADKLRREINHTANMVNNLGASIKEFDTGTIEPILDYCRDHKRED